MADSNRTSVAYVKESTFGSTPSGPPTLVRVPYKSFDFKHTTDTKVSEIIRSDAQRLEPQQLNIGMNGDLVSELIYGAFDTWMASALRDTAWSSAVPVKTADTTISFNASTGVITLGTGTWTNTPTVGSWIRVSGADDAGNNSVFKVAASTTTTITVENKSSMVTDTAGPSITISQGSEINNGVGLDSYSLETQNPDLAVPLFPRYVGATIDRLSLDVSVGNFANIGFGFMGKKEISPIPTATAGSGSDTDYTANPSMQCVDNVLKIAYGGTDVELAEWKMDIGNGLAPRNILGSLGPTSIRAGSFDVTGSVKAYFQSAALFNDFLANAVGSISMVFKDSASGTGNVYVFDLPAMKFSGGSRPVSGVNTDQMQDLSLIGFRDSAEGITLRAVRFPTA